VELDGYCKYSLLFVRSIRITAKTRKTQDFFQKKTHFSPIHEIETNPKNRKIDASWHVNVIYWGWMKWGHFWKIEFFTKTAIPPTWRNFRISENFNLHETMYNSMDIENIRSHLWGAYVKPRQLAKCETLLLKNHFFQNFLKMKLSPKIGNLSPPDTELIYIMINNP
jgi:hypothetical protein